MPNGSVNHLECTTHSSVRSSQLLSTVSVANWMLHTCWCAKHFNLLMHYPHTLCVVFVAMATTSVTGCVRVLFEKLNCIALI